MLTAWLLTTPTAGADTMSRLSSRFLARGEQALLEVAVSGAQPGEFPVIPTVDGVEIKSGGRVRTQQLVGRRVEYVFDYLVSSYAIGSHLIPAIEVIAGGVRTRTEPLEFTVFDPDELQWSEAQLGTSSIRYASTFRVMNPHPYTGETTPVEIKVFVPRELFVEDWGIPDFQRDGVTAWRCQPSAMRGQVNLLGQPYVAVAYPSTLSPTRTGAVAIGPATIRLVTTQVVMDGILRRVAQEVNLTVPRLALDARPLPEGAPAGFDNAVGSFKLEVTSNLTKVQEGDPIPLDIVVSGSGNLDTMRPPRPVDATGWKLYDATTEQRGDERRELAGKTVFHQFMRPLDLKAEVPAFRLVYFDPKAAAYQTLTTSPIPLKITPAARPKPAAEPPPAALPVPVERMTDILGVLRGASSNNYGGRRLPGWLGHAMAGLLALGLIAMALWRRAGDRLRHDPVRAARRRDLRVIERWRGDDDTEFLRLAGRFIERWLGAGPTPEVQAVLAERDANCFRQEQPTAAVLDPRRRAAIIKLLRQAAMVWLAICLLGVGTSHAGVAEQATSAVAAYDAANYQQAISLWLQGDSYANLPADTLYNIGNACYRAGSPGHAALYYRRALVRDSGHQEARQNLRFIERKCGAITVHRPDYQYALAAVPLQLWTNMVWTGAWLCLLAVLVFPATAVGSRWRVVALGALVIGPLLGVAGGFGWRYFPDDAQFAPPARQAVIVGANAVLHTDAARTSPPVIDAPVGSLCEVISESGRWAYVAFATKTRGWIPVELLDMVIPTSPPVPPTIPKPPVTAKDA